MAHTIKPEPGKVYRNGKGQLVHIEGLARTLGDVAIDNRWWSLEADHYNVHGRQVHREYSDQHALAELVGEHSDAGKGEGWSHSYCTACYGPSGKETV